jgi:hypothetical protein
MTDNATAVRECCALPNFKLRHIELSCFNTSRGKFLNASGNATFVEEVALCYLSEAGLWKGDTFDKKRAIEIYSGYDNLNLFNHTKVPVWKETIEKAVNLCTFNSSKALRKSMDDFYNCSNEYLLSNCAAVMATDECQQTFEQFEKCKKVSPKCDKWPLEIMMPEYCCNYPQLITDKLRIEFRTKCAATTKTYRDQAKCVKDLIDKKFKPTGKFDYSEVKATLTGNVNSSNPRAWDQIVEKAVEACKVFIEGIHLIVS